MVKPGCGRYPIISRIIQRLLDTSLKNWHSDVMDNRKLETYSTYKIDFCCLETYLTIDMYHNHRIEYTRFRCSSHNLAIEKLRPTHDRVDSLQILSRPSDNRLILRTNITFF